MCANCYGADGLLVVTDPALESRLSKPAGFCVLGNRSTVSIDLSRSLDSKRLLTHGIMLC